MSESTTFPPSSKDKHNQPEDIDENILLGIPSKQRSCAAVNIPSACVNKAIHHIQVLEEKVEESFQQYDQLYKLEKISWNIDTKSDEETKVTLLPISSELKDKCSLYWEDIQPLKQKTTRVLAEVRELVTRLEKERKDAEEALEFEKRRRKKLFGHADHLSLWRLQQLPIAVQKEWEKCSQDIDELQWHFEQKRQQLQDAVSKLSKIDTANAKILEHINFMKMHSPLLGEKLTYEDNFTQQVKNIYRKTKEVYDVVHDKLLKVKKSHDALVAECEKIRKNMSEEIESIEALLNHFRSELKEAETAYNDFCAKIQQKQEAILQVKKHIEELIKQETGTKADLESWQDKLRRLALKIAAQEDENKYLLDSNLEKIQSIESSKSIRKSDEQDLKDKLKRYMKEIINLQNESKRLHNENGAFMQKFKDSAKRKAGYQGEIRVITKNIRRLETHLKKLNTELYAVELSYEDAKIKLEELEKDIAKDKMRFKNMEENVKKQIQEEVSAWTLTQKRLKALQAELDKKRKANEKIQEKILRRLAELQQCIAEQTELLSKNKETQKKITEEIDEVNQKIQELDKKEKELKTKLEEEKNSLKKQVNDLKDNYLIILKKLADVNDDIVKFQNEIAKLNALTKAKENVIDTTDKSIAELREKLARIQAKEQYARALVVFLYDRLDYVKKKVRTDGRVLEEKLWNRQEALKLSKITLEEWLEENLRLAQEYQMLQIGYLHSKNELVDFYDHKVMAEAALRDQQQLSRLQRKVHGGLLEYFKLRALCSQAGLAKFQAASHENLLEILAVQGGLSEALNHTEMFFKTLADGSFAMETMRTTTEPETV